MKRLLLLALSLVALCFSPPGATGAAATPVVLLHGCCGATAASMDVLAAAYQAQGYTVYNLQLNDTFDPDKNVKQLRDFLNANNLTGVHLVGHSLGGLEARCYAKFYGTSRVAKVVTIDAPHDGWIFWWAWAGVCNIGDDTPGPVQYYQLWQPSPFPYVLDGGVCLETISGDHNTLPSQSDVIAKVLAASAGQCLGVWQ